MRTKTWVAAALTASVLVLGVTGVAQATGEPATTSTTTTAVEYSAEEYVTGIFFGVGPVADRLPEITSRYRTTAVDYPDLPAAAKEVSSALLAHIAADDPGFLASFKAAVTSGDHVRIRAALSSGADVLAGAYSAVYPDADGDQVTCGGLVCGAVVVIVVIVLVVSVITHHIDIVNSELIQGGGLSADQLVDRIATELVLA